MKSRFLRNAIMMLAIFILSPLVAVSSYACSGYSGVYSIGVTHSSVSGQTTKCSCAPVSNFLKVRVRAQYLEDDLYFWTNYSSKSEYDAQRISISKHYSQYVYYGEANFSGYCNTGSGSFNVTTGNVAS